MFFQKYQISKDLAWFLDYEYWLLYFLISTFFGLKTRFKNIENRGPYCVCVDYSYIQHSSSTTLFLTYHTYLLTSLLNEVRVKKERSKERFLEAFCLESPKYFWTLFFEKKNPEDAKNHVIKKIESTISTIRRFDVWIIQTDISGWIIK